MKKLRWSGVAIWLIGHLAVMVAMAEDPPEQSYPQTHVTYDMPLTELRDFWTQRLQWRTFQQEGDMQFAGAMRRTLENVGSNYYYTDNWLANACKAYRATQHRPYFQLACEGADLVWNNATQIPGTNYKGWITREYGTTFLDEMHISLGLLAVAEVLKADGQQGLATDWANKLLNNVYPRYRQEYRNAVSKQQSEGEWSSRVYHTVVFLDMIGRILGSQDVLNEYQAVEMHGEPAFDVSHLFIVTYAQTGENPRQVIVQDQRSTRDLQGNRPHAWGKYPTSYDTGHASYTTEMMMRLEQVQHYPTGITEALSDTLRWTIWNNSLEFPLFRNYANGLNIPFEGRGPYAGGIVNTHWAATTVLNEHAMRACVSLLDYIEMEKPRQQDQPMPPHNHSAGANSATVSRWAMMCNMVWASTFQGTLPGIPEPPLCGDFNRDGRVDLADFSTFQVCFGRTAPYDDFCRPTDMNKDGKVDLSDYSSFSVCYGAGTR